MLGARARAAQAASGESGGWTVGEVVCDSFLFTMLGLRGAGSGALLEVLGEEEGGGRGETVEAGQTTRRTTKRHGLWFGLVPLTSYAGCLAELLSHHD